MLPFGIIEFNRPTKFTHDEQVLCMTLWCIARSPLILGADMTKLDDFTLHLLTNPEVLAVNQASTANHQLSRQNDLVVWTAEVLGSRDRYVAFFNAQGNDDPVDLSQAAYQSPVLRGAPGKEVADISVPIHGARHLVLAVGDGGDGNFYDHAAWIEPKLIGAKGTLKLTDLKWKLAKAGWREVQLNRTVEGQPLTFHGQPVEGIGTHAVSTIEYDLPAGYDTFTARGVITAGSQGKGSLQFAVLLDPDTKAMPERSKVSVSFTALGITGKARVRDLWNRRDLGEFDREFDCELPLHGAGLYRVTPVNQ